MNQQYPTRPPAVRNLKSDMEKDEMSRPEFLQYATLFDIPAFIEPWIDRFFEPADIRLILEINTNTYDYKMLAKKMVSWFGPESEPNALIQSAWKRGILNRVPDNRCGSAGQIKYSLADFHARFEIWALFEGWKDIPREIQNRLNEWEMDSYIRNHREVVELLKSGGTPDPALVRPMYLLCQEAIDLMDRVDRIWLWPCNCRAMVGGCRQNKMTCLRFDNSRDIGWEISRDRAKEIVLEANAKGLMQSGEIGVDPAGNISGALCNCCPDCCYPHQLSLTEKAIKYWPETRYRARLTPETCTACGKCIRRCPFGLFAFKNAAENKKKKRKIRFNADPCRGCGLCATGCKDNAIEMISLENAPALSRLLNQV